jgi:two-component system chemotaxis response regulator CheB
MGQKMNSHDYTPPFNKLVVVGASLGGIAALKRLLSGLPADLDVAVMIVQHLSSQDDSYLPEILARSSRLPVTQAVHGIPLQGGRVYIACPNQHMVVMDQSIQHVFGPRENRARPSIDALFRSAAVVYGPRTIGIILTGHLNDGTSGLSAIKRCGGVAIVQDPDEAEYPDMPRNALDAVEADHILPVDEMAPCPFTPVSGAAAGNEELENSQVQNLEKLSWELLRHLQERKRLVEVLIEKSRNTGRDRAVECFKVTGERVDDMID